MYDKKMKLSFCKGDLAAVLLVAVLAVLAGLFFLSSTALEEGSILKVYQEGRLIRELSLNTDAEFIITGTYQNKIVIKDGKASIAESDCPGNDCVHSGEICENGRSIVCLPNRVELRIAGSSEVDFVVR